MSTKVEETIDEDVKRRAFEKLCQVRIYQLFQLAEVINLASARGAFRGSELSHVGALFDTLTKGVDQAFKMAKEEVEATKVQAPTVTAGPAPTPLGKVTAGMKNLKVAGPENDVTKV